MKDNWKKINKGLGKFTEVTNKAISKSSNSFNKGAQKSTEIMNNKMSGRKTIKCPKCKSTNVQYMNQDKKGFSLGKAVGGSLLAGNVGSLAGFAGKKGKNNFHCQNCGTTFKK